MNNRVKIFLLLFFSFWTILNIITGLINYASRPPKEALQIWDTIEEICMKHELTPTIRAVQGENGNLFFHIDCIESI